MIHPQLSMDRNSLDVEQSGETVLEELGHQATLEDLATDEDNTVIEPAELGRWAAGTSFINPLLPELFFSSFFGT